MFCKKCGSEIPDNSEFCQYCGEPVKGEAKTVVTVENDAAAYRKQVSISERNVVLAILLTIITCGLYSIYWQIKLNDEMLELSHESGHSGGMVVLFTILTCGLYGYYWSYKMGQCVDKVKGGGSHPVIFLLLQLFGLGLVNYIICQITLNDHATGFGN